MGKTRKKLIGVLVTCIITLASIIVVVAGIRTNYKAVDISDWAPKSSNSILDLVAPLYKGFPEGIGGQQRLQIDMRKDDSTGGYVIYVEMTGYLDDEIVGQRYRANVRHYSKGWKLISLEYQHKCARTLYKGWHAKLCS